MIKKITAGNDIHITWNVTKNEQTNLDNVTIALFDTFKKAVPFTYEVNTQDNEHLTINGLYKGKDQKTFGKYAIVLYNNQGKDSMTTLCYTEAFVLVHALKNKLSAWGNPIADSAQNVEIDSNLKAELGDDAVKDIRVNGVSVIHDQIADISINDYSQDIEIMNSSINQIINEIEDDEYVVTQAIVNINNSIDDISDISTSINNINSSINIIKDDIENIESSINQIINGIEDDEYVISQAIVSVQSSIDNINNQITNIDSSIDDICNEINYYWNNYLNDVSIYAIDVSSRLQTTNTNVTNLISQVNDFSSYTINASTNLEAINARLNTIDVSIDYFENTMQPTIMALLQKLDASVQSLYNS